MVLYISVLTMAPNSHATSDHGDATHSLAYKVLRLPMFSCMDALTPDFRLFGVFLLEGKVHMPLLEGSQAVTAPSMEKDLVALRAKLAAKAIAAFVANPLPPATMQPSKN